MDLGDGHDVSRNLSRAGPTTHPRFVTHHTMRQPKQKVELDMENQSTENAPHLAAPTAQKRLPQHDVMSSLIGKWITVGETIATDNAPALEIHASDIYEWVAGRFFVLHTAYGRIGDADVGGIEIIGYDPATGKYKTHFFDSEGNISNQDLTFKDGTWTWSGDNARAMGTLSADGATMPTRHEWSDDGVNWRTSMNVTLHKVV
jgi:hypothetical protein